jgi:hypothetical protein
MRSKRQVSKARRYWWLAPVIAIVLLIAWVATGPEWSKPRHGTTTTRGLPAGYVSSFATVDTEFVRYNGKQLQDNELAGQFEQASRHMADHDYGVAAELLDSISKKAAVPAVFNNLGLAYLAMNDREHGVNAFREALSRDIDYRQVRETLERMREIGIESATPLTHEMEDNNSLLSANIIALGKPVEGEIMGSVNDIDCFKVTAPPAPRDTLEISVKPRSKLLVPMMRVYDGERRMLEWVKGSQAPGQPISVTIAPRANSTLYLEIAGLAESAGLYTVEVTPLKRFDAHEPNDDIFNARPIAMGQDVAANIMDKSDTDYYSFEAPRTGKVRLKVTNRSLTLIPALSTFAPDMRSTGFGPDVRVRGGNLEHSMEVEEGKKYFLQVWSQADTAGEYTLRVEM